MIANFVGLDTQIPWCIINTNMTTPHPSTQNIKVAVDAAIFTIKNGDLCLLLIQMKKSPFEGMWAIPGGLIEDHETSLQSASRILKTQTGLHDVFLEQLKTFDDPGRDPAGRVVSVACWALVPDHQIPLKTTDKYLDVRWWRVGKLPELAYDHQGIAKEAVERLKSKIQYTNIVWSLLPEEFTLTQLQSVYEIIVGSSLDKRNFRKRIRDLKLIRPVGKKLAGAAHRPAELYRFRQRKLEYVEIV